MLILDQIRVSIPSPLDLLRRSRQSEGVHVIAIHYTPGAGEALVEGLAEALGTSLYEARTRLSSPEGGPVVVGNFAEIQPAWAFAGRLRANGISPIQLEPAEVETDAERFLVRSFELGERGIEAVSRQGKTVTLAYQDIDFVLRGVRIDARLERRRTEVRKFSPTRALMTGGLMATRTIRQMAPVTEEQREDFLYLYSGGQPPLAFEATAVNYRSLGAARQPSTAANFAFLVEELRRLLPQARFDGRLTNRQARARVLGPSLTENHLDVAVTLLARVLRPRSA
jgi:hypothetical protein